MTADTAAPALTATSRNVMDRIRYMVLGTIDEDGCTSTSLCTSSRTDTETSTGCRTRRATTHTT
jgi:hypothetical protein